MKKMSFEEFVSKKSFPDDTFQEKVSDSIWTSNLQEYFNLYMVEYGKDLLFEFWNHKSDANTLESDAQDNQLADFEKYIINRFSNSN